MRRLTKLPINPILRDCLNNAGPGFADIYSRHSSAKAFDESRLAKYTHIVEIDEDHSRKIAIGLLEKLKAKPLRSGAGVIDLKSSQVIQSTAMDIELAKQDGFGAIMLSSKDDMTVRYGDVGISSSQHTSPLKLLKYKLEIPKSSVGVLEIKNHTPFLIEAKNPQEAIAIATCDLSKVFDHEKNIKRYSLATVCQLSADDIKRMTIELQRRIFHDYKKESFFEEVASKVYQPTEYNRSSGTLINFEKDFTTAMHYHPGERSLHIFTTKRPAAVTLNFCGIAENPDSRKDCEVHVPFPENSMVVLNFPSYTHHKFHGDFVCMSVHPREGDNLIQAVQSGTLPKNFLESATVFSVTKENQEKWDISLPERSDEMGPRSSFNSR